jgi:hypothetical protein
VEPELEPLAAFEGEVEPRFGGFTWLQLEIHQRSYFAKRLLNRLNSTREATPPEEPEPEPFLEEPEPCQTGPYYNLRFEVLIKGPSSIVIICSPHSPPTSVVMTCKLNIAFNLKF